MKTEILEERMKNWMDENSRQHKEMMGEITAINEKLDKKFVTIERFSPIEKLVYSLVGIIVGSVVLGLVGLLIMR